MESLSSEFIFSYEIFLSSVLYKLWCRTTQRPWLNWNNIPFLEAHLLATFLDKWHVFRLTINLHVPFMVLRHLQRVFEGAGDKASFTIDWRFCYPNTCVLPWALYTQNCYPLFPLNQHRLLWISVSLFSSGRGNFSAEHWWCLAFFYFMV
jgi:hypothetical protein